MHLCSVELEHWRGLEKAALLDLSDRLNLIVGPNESGKSRLFESIYFGLFETHKGSAAHKQALQSWSSPEVPSVTLCFEHNGTEYELQKRFLKQPFAQLAGGGVTLKGEDAEERLRELLGTRAGGNRGADLADRGIWPVLMVAQGDSRASVSDHLSENSRAHLQGCLSASIGEAVIGAQGQKLLDRIEAEYARFYTPKSGQLLASVKALGERVEEAREALAAARQRLAEQQGLADALEEKRAALAALRQRLAPLEVALVEADKRAATAASAQAQVRQAATDRQLAEQAHREAQRAKQDREQADGVVQSAIEEIKALEREVAEREEGLRLAREARAQADAELAAARDTATSADAAVAESRKADEARRLAREVADLDKLIEKLSGLEAKWLALEAEAARKPAITAEDAASLRTLSDTAATAEAKLQGAAVSVDIVARQALTVDGRALAAGERHSLRITSNRAIELGDLASIEIAPGGGELVKLQGAADKAGRAFADALSKLGVSSLAQAEEVSAWRAHAEQRIDGWKGQAEEASDDSVAELRNRREAIEGQLQQLPAVEGALSLTDAMNEAAVAQSEREAAAARSAEAAAALVKLETDSAMLAQRIDTAKQRLETAQARVAPMPALEVLAADEQAAADTHASAEKTHDDLAAAFESGGGAQAAEDALAAKRAVDAMAGRIRDAERAVAAQEGELRQSMRDAPFEKVQDLEAELDLALAQEARVTRDASAAKLLRDTLAQARREVVERLTAPVIERVRPYLADIFPGSNLDAGDDLAFNGLKSGSVSEPFAALSGGAQEQVSLLTRIGLAEVLANGARLPLMLDDALVNTDPARIRLIQRALRRAAQSGLQVLLFSCHDELFDAMGADKTFVLPKRR